MTLPDDDKLTKTQWSELTDRAHELTALVGGIGLLNELSMPYDSARPTCKKARSAVYVMLDVAHNAASKLTSDIDALEGLVSSECSLEPAHDD